MIDRLRNLTFVVPIFAALWSGAFANAASAQDAPPEPTPGVLATPAANLDCATATAPTTTYAIDSENSEVRYLAEEELVGQGANTAIGSTKAFIGTIYFDESGLPLPCSRWDADLRTLTSDDSRRDNFLYNNTLETQTYPLATFILTAVEGLDQPLGSEDVTFTLIGDLTIHGVTKAVSWSATAKLDGDTLTGSASTSFDMADFDIEPPIVGRVVSLDETVKLEADITAKPQA